MRGAEGIQEDREGGFVVLHRRIESWPLWRSLRGEQRHVVTTILLLANWGDGTFWYGTTPVKVGRGELAHSLETIAERAAVSIKVVRTVVAKLLAEGFLGTRSGTESGTGPRVLIVRNYELYQSITESTGTATGTRAGTAGAQHGHSRGTKRTRITRINQKQPTTPQSPTAPAAPFPAPERLKVPTEADMFAAWGRDPPGPEPRAALPEGGIRKRVSDMLVRVFAELNPGAAYGWKGSRDGKALSELLEKADERRIEALWRQALLHRGYPTVRTVHALSEHWNEVQALHAPAPTTNARARQAQLDAVKREHRGDGWLTACREYQAEHPELSWPQCEEAVAAKLANPSAGARAC